MATLLTVYVYLRRLKVTTLLRRSWQSLHANNWRCGCDRDAFHKEKVVEPRVTCRIVLVFHFTSGCKRAVSEFFFCYACEVGSESLYIKFDLWKLCSRSLYSMYAFWRPVLFFSIARIASQHVQILSNWNSKFYLATNMKHVAVSESKLMEKMCVWTHTSCITPRFRTWLCINCAGVQLYKWQNKIHFSNNYASCVNSSYNLSGIVFISFEQDAALPAQSRKKAPAKLCRAGMYIGCGHFHGRKTYTVATWNAVEKSRNKCGVKWLYF